jgi:hypothetical protein
MTLALVAPFFAAILVFDPLRRAAVVLIRALAEGFVEMSTSFAPVINTTMRGPQHWIEDPLRAITGRQRPDYERIAQLEAEAYGAVDDAQ